MNEKMNDKLSKKTHTAAKQMANQIKGGALMKTSRRRFILGSLAAFVGALGLLTPLRALAKWPKTLFSQTDFNAVVNELTQGLEVKKLAMLEAPKIAENGGQVRVSVKMDAPEVAVKKISLVVEKNPVALTSQFILHKDAVPNVSINLKVRETSRIIALAEADGVVYKDETEVQVTAGGCG